MKREYPYFDIAGLIIKSLKGEITTDESAQLKSWITENKENEQLWQKLSDPKYLEERVGYWEQNNNERRWEKLEADISNQQAPQKGRFRKFMRYAAIVLPLIALCGIGGYRLSRHEKNNPAVPPEINEGNLSGIHIMPKGKVAQLILGNGTAISLNGKREEYITEKDGTKVQNHEDELSYSDSKPGKEQVIYNTLITPRGGEYAVVLSDGTKIWLNAASSLHYPTRFDGKERKVYLSGEGYFEVAKDAMHPFVVEAGNINVQVLGTKFDIASYPDDPRHKATLVEGAVRIAEVGAAGVNGKSVLLNPGYEAVLTKNRNTIQVDKANVEDALAWKNGLFIFDGESLGNMMRKLSRWYDINVKYEGGVDTMFHFTGRIQRYENITGILHLIELTGKVTFIVKNHDLYVSPSDK